MPRPRIVISLGDPAGIGPEVVLRALSETSVRKLAHYILVGHDEVLHAARERCGVDLKWRRVDPAALRFGPTVGLLEPCPLKGKPPKPGRWTSRTGRLSLACVETAITLAVGRVADALVTGPISKAAWNACDAPWPGHTELLAERTGVDDFVMMLIGGGLRVALATIHEPLRKVPALITPERITATVQTVHKALWTDFGIKRPRIAVLGLNPHAGEGGHLGHDENRCIGPTVRALRKRRIDVTGPLPADSTFYHAMNGAFDAVVAMYHDQGLGPLKTVAFESGVNVTLGLPIIRSSVDHGTAFDIAPQGRSNPTSCIEAIRTAAEMARHRHAMAGD